MKSLLNAHSLSQIVDKPTHVSGHIIDWLIVPEKLKISDFSVDSKRISDHFPMLFSLDLAKPVRGKRTVTSRNLRSIDVAALFFSGGDRAEDYNRKLGSVLDAHAPLRSRQVLTAPPPPG